MVLVNLGFYTQKNFFEIIHSLGTHHQRRFTGPVLGQNSLKNIGFKGCYIINLPRVPTCIRSALSAIEDGASPTFCIDYR
jgi:hypothetical protein